MKERQDTNEMYDNNAAPETENGKQTSAQNENAEQQQEDAKINKADEIAELNQKVQEINDKYVRIYAEFDNFRRRTLKEKMDLIKNGGEDVLTSLLPVMDNFERALNSMQAAKDIEAVKQGVELIYNNFKDFLSQKGVKEIESKNQEFNTDFHEAMTKIQVPDENMKGKVVDVIQKGYFLHEKVIRFAKVVIGE